MNLTPLFEEALQFQAYNGTLLSNGKVAIYHLGRTRLADIYDSPDATVPLQNPVILDNLGMQPVYVSPDFNYTMVVMDQYNQELFSVDKYIYSDGAHAHADVAVGPSESIGVSSYTVGDTTIYVPYLTSAVGKVYSGIEPIVVNNEQDLISANTVPFGVQEPLYLAEDSTATIIGCSGDTEPYVNHDRTIKIDNHVVSTDMQAVMIRQQINTSSDEYKYAKICEADLNTITWINEWMTTLQLNFQSCGAYYKGKSVGTFVLNCENYVTHSGYSQQHEEDGKWVLFDKDNNSPQIVKLYLYWRDDSSSQHYELWGEFANLKYFEGVGVAAVLNCSLRNHLTSSLPIDQERNIWRFNPIGVETLKNALPTNAGNLVGQYLPDDASIKPVSDDSAGTFYATYVYGGPSSGNTSFDDIKAAYDAGKAVYVNYKENTDSKDTEIYSLVLFRDTPMGRPDLSCFFFSNLDRGTGKTIYRFPSNWGKMSEQNFANSNDLWHLSLAVADHATNIVCPIPSGTYATYDYRFYKANQEITSTGTYADWDANQWDQVTIGEVLYNLEHTTAASDIFWADYGTTTHTEVNEAVNAGKQVICRVGTGIYLQLSYVSVVNGYPVFYFTGGEPEISGSTMVVMQCHLSVDGWEDSYHWYPIANSDWVTAYVESKTSGALSSIYQPYAAAATTGNLVFSAERYPRQTFACISGTDTTATAGVLPPVPERNLSSTQILVAASGSLADVAWREFDVSALTGKQDTLTFHYLEI